jgi:aspartyl protease family protein
MVDTGASFVVLSPDDAEYLGFDFWNEDYTYKVRTATGEYAMAPIMIDEIEIGDDIRIFNVRGAVINEGSEVSLLGLSFLNKLKSYQFSGDELILTP